MPGSSAAMLPDASIAPSPARSRPLAWASRISPAFLVLLALIAIITALNREFLTPGSFMSFLKRSAPLAILATGQLFVIVVGGFDLAVGWLITFVVLGSALLIDGDGERTLWVMPLMLGA